VKNEKRRSLRARGTIIAGLDLLSLDLSGGKNLRLCESPAAKTRHGEGGKRKRTRATQKKGKKRDWRIQKEATVRILRREPTGRSKGEQTRFEKKEGGDEGKDEELPRSMEGRKRIYRNTTPEEEEGDMACLVVRRAIDSLKLLKRKGPRTQFTHEKERAAY